MGAGPKGGAMGEGFLERALDEGRMAGCRAAYALGYLSEQEYEENKRVLLERLNALRCGPFGEKRRTAKEALWNAME